MKKSPKFKPTVHLREGKFVADDPISIQSLRQSFYGVKTGDRLVLHPIEAMYLTNIRRVPCFSGSQTIEFNEIFNEFSHLPRLFARYNVFRDWRDRGIFIQLPEQVEKKNFGHSPVVKYPSEKVEIPVFDVNLFYYSDDMISFVYDRPASRELFEKFWIGQLGVYKQPTRDKILKLDIMETLLLAKLGYSVVDVKRGKELDFNDILKQVKRKEPFISSLFDVYEDWRSRGYILKTGFKFGAHFRIYFPGASPIRSKSKWLHSKHVVHVFDKDEKMIMSEWARAVRVAHSVRKTFIMAIPGMTKEDYEDIEFDFFGYHRRGMDVEKPGKHKPRYLIIALTEDEEIGGRWMASALSKADEMGLSLVFAISDRETSVTYYMARLIDLPNSRNKYYEIQWLQP